MRGLRTLVLMVGLAAASTTAAVEVDAEVLAAMQRELAALRERVATLEARLDQPGPVAAALTAPLPASPSAPAPPPEIAPIPSSALSFGGRIKVDAIASSVSAGGPGGTNVTDFFYSPGQIPLDGGGEQDQFGASVRGSRVFVQALEPTARGPAAAYIELDLFGSPAGNERVSNSLEPRLRHAYGDWSGWTFGQTFSTFMNPSAFPEINDDGMPAGGILVRQPLLRWSGRLGAGELALAAESPETTLALADGTRAAPDDDRLPDFVARYTVRRSSGNVALAGMVRQLRVDDRTLARGAHAALGFGLSASGRMLVGREELRFMLSGGNALGRYMSFNAFDDARLGIDGDIDPVTSVGGYLAWQHGWSRRWRTNLVAGGAWQDDDGAAALKNEHVLSVHANLLWSPLPSTTAGLEFIYGRRHRFDGRDGELARLQLTAIRKF